eukprot:jgi/Ulvmu1/11836/UM080_0048.1
MLLPETAALDICDQLITGRSVASASAPAAIDRRQLVPVPRPGLCSTATRRYADRLIPVLISMTPWWWCQQAATAVFAWAPVRPHSMHATSPQPWASSRGWGVSQAGRLVRLVRLLHMSHKIFTRNSYLHT